MHSSKLKVLAVATAAVACLGWDLAKRLAIRRNRGIARGKRFLVVGGGFAGVEACRGLERLLPGVDNGEIILVDEAGYLLFTPMLTEAVGGMVNPNHIIVPLASFTERTKIISREVKSIDLARRSIQLADSDPLAADHLVISLGATTNFHGAPGVEQTAITVKSLQDANRIREGALDLLEKAIREPDRAVREAMLTFVVAGGGYTGVETIAALNELLRETAARDGSDIGSELRMLLVEPLGRLMSEVTEDLASYTQKQLERDGIEVRLKTGIRSVDGDLIELTTGDKVRSRMLIWSAGIEASHLVSSLPEAKGKLKALPVSADLALPGFKGVWAVGDCAEIPQPHGRGPYGATAQNATREGQLVARNIVRSLHGEALQPFRYTPIGELALVGMRRGVARIYNMNFSGFTAYLLWRLVYIAKLPLMTQRLRVLGDWFLDATLGPVAEVQRVPPTSRKRSASA